MDIEQELNLEELRGRCLEHSRKAYQMLPPLNQPRILDVGCGSGVATVELARWSGGEVVGIDIDQLALARLQRKIERGGLTGRIRAIQVSLFDNEFDDESFDVIWEEGVLHLLDASKSLSECFRLLKPDRTLVMHESIVWFESIRDKLGKSGFDLVNQHMLPRHYWWTQYGAPLEEHIRKFRKTHGDAAASEKLAEHDAVVAQIKADPDRTDCGFYILRKCE